MITDYPKKKKGIDYPKKKKRTEGNLMILELLTLGPFLKVLLDLVLKQHQAGPFFLKCC